MVNQETWSLLSAHGQISYSSGKAMIFGCRSISLSKMPWLVLSKRWDYCFGLLLKLIQCLFSYTLAIILLWPWSWCHSCMLYESVMKHTHNISTDVCRDHAESQSELAIDFMQKSWLHQNSFYAKMFLCYHCPSPKTEFSSFQVVSGHDWLLT